jgi:hypothetical protein
MPLSISSSRRISIATILGGLVIFLGALLVFRVLLYLLSEAGVDFGNERILEALDALPEMVENQPAEKSVMVFGSSMVEAAFSPREFDRQIRRKGIDVVSYNFGLPGLNPVFQEILSRRIRDIYRSQDKKLQLALVEFNPFQNTLKRRDNDSFTADQRFATLSSIGELWQIILDDPARGVRLLTIRYLRGRVSAELITGLLGFSMSVPEVSGFSPGQIEALKKYHMLTRAYNRQLKKDLVHLGRHSWFAGFRGGRPGVADMSQQAADLLGKLMESARHPVVRELDLKHRTKCCDIEGLMFDDELVDAFIETVRNFQSISEHVEVILLPKNKLWVRYTPESGRRLTRVLDRITAATGVSIRNYQNHPGFWDRYFSDVSHLTLNEGRQRFTDLLAEEYLETLDDSYDPR